VIRAVFLDSGPLSLITNPRPSEQVLACNEWLRRMTAAGVRIVIPEIADYEVRRELLRASRRRGLANLETLIALSEYVPLTTIAMRQAAEYWAQARRQGQPTASDQALDADMILAAQVRTWELPLGDIVVATTNVRHLGRFVPAAEWPTIRPQ
jgi:predicted nucleic acid-binding protein